MKAIMSIAINTTAVDRKFNIISSIVKTEAMSYEFRYKMIRSV